METDNTRLCRPVCQNHAITVTQRIVFCIKLKDEVGKLGIALCCLFVKLLDNDHVIMTFP